MRRTNMTNLLEETREAIAASGHLIRDIVFVGSGDSNYCCSWCRFCKLADKEYDSGFGNAKVALDLIVVFRDGERMWRNDYDGSESWVYLTPFEPPREKKRIERLFVPRKRSGCCTLAGIHGEDGD